MKRPLYQDHAAPDVCHEDAHTGLWFDKFCNQWCRNPEETGPSAWSLRAFSTGRGNQRQDFNPKIEWIRSVTQRPCGWAKLLAEHAARLADLARALHGQSVVLLTTSRFATGLGREHPVENGFVWHPILGVPYLPGSSVKGLVRAWATTWAEPTSTDIVRNRILGGPGGQGTVLFLDAVPTKPVELKADIMTPHNGEYYQGNAPPADWLSPNPIPFLTVAPGQSFQFALAPAPPAAQPDCATAAQWLTDALAWMGAGAKTAVGYGRFARTDTPSEPAPEPGNSEPAATQSRMPRFKPGQRVTTRRIDDPKERGRVWFEAEDGFGGVVTAGPPPTVEVGQTVELEVASVIRGLGYNFRVPRLVLPPTKPKAPRRHP